MRDIQQDFYFKATAYGTRPAIYLLSLITEDGEDPTPSEIREVIRLLRVYIGLPTPAK